MTTDEGGQGSISWRSRFVCDTRRTPDSIRGACRNHFDSAVMATFKGNASCKPRRFSSSGNKLITGILTARLGLINSNNSRIRVLIGDVQPPCAISPWSLQLTSSPKSQEEKDVKAGYLTFGELCPSFGPSQSWDKSLNGRCPFIKHLERVRIIRNFMPGRRTIGQEAVEHVKTCW